MTRYRVGYFVGSLATNSINRALSRALIRLAPPELELVEIPIKDLPLYSYDYDAHYPVECAALKHAIASADAVLFVTPEYNRALPGGLKNAIDWASRPPGDNSFTGKPSAVIGASPGRIGTAVAQQHLRGVLSYCDSPHMNAPEAYIQFIPGLFTDAGEVTDISTSQFLHDFMEKFRAFIVRVLTMSAGSEPASQERDMATPDVERLLDDWAIAWSSKDGKDPERVLALFVDDCVFEDVTVGAVAHGKEELRTFTNGAFAAVPDFKYRLTRRFATGQWAAIEWEMSGTHNGDFPGVPATGKSFSSVRGSSVLELAAGKIRRESDYWDAATLMKQVGLLPA
jgi:chromate reductase